MPFHKIYERPDGSQVKVEPVLEVDRFDNEAFTWSYIIYRAAPCQEEYEDVTNQHLLGPVYATEQEILECQLVMREMFRPRM